MPVLASMAAGEAPKPKVRAQAPDAPTTTSAKLTLPSPEELGVGTAPSAPVAATATAPAVPREVDWNDAHARLRRIGALGFQLERIPTGHRVTFLLPTGQGDRTHHIEVAAPSEAVAVQTALQEAETWAARK